MEQTATLKLNKPAKGTFDWDVPLNENWDKLDCLGAGQMPLLGQLIVDRKLTGAEATGWALQGSVLDGNVYKSVYSILSAARGRAVKENRTIKGATYTTYRDATTQLVFVDQSVYNNAFSALGDSIGYVINTSTKQIILPKRETFLRATIGKANYMDDESLPNIKGKVGAIGGTGFVAEGAFYDAGSGGILANTGEADKNAGFDASRSSSAYKNGALVRPRHTTVYIYYRVGNTIVNQEQIDVGNLTNQVNSLSTNKANKDFSNVASNIDYVIESGSNYMKFKSKKLIVWGDLNTSSSATLTATFPKPFSAIPYYINVTSVSNISNYLTSGYIASESLTTTGFQYGQYDTQGGKKTGVVKYVAIGQGA